jgi:hypothetical protein
VETQESGGPADLLSTTKSTQGPTGKRGELPIFIFELLLLLVMLLLLLSEHLSMFN